MHVDDLAPFRESTTYDGLHAVRTDIDLYDDGSVDSRYLFTTNDRAQIIQEDFDNTFDDQPESRSTFEWDGDHRVRQIYDSGMDGWNQDTTWTWVDGLNTTRADTYPTGETRTTTYTYDDDGREIRSDLDWVDGWTETTHDCP